MDQQYFINTVKMAGLLKVAGSWVKENTNTT